jgi:hypothetical protein
MDRMIHSLRTVKILIFIVVFCILALPLSKVLAQKEGAIETFANGKALYLVANSTGMNWFITTLPGAAYYRVFSGPASYQENHQIKEVVGNQYVVTFSTPVVYIAAAAYDSSDQIVATSNEISCYGIVMQNIIMPTALTPYYQLIYLRPGNAPVPPTFWFSPTSGPDTSQGTAVSNGGYAPEIFVQPGQQMPVITGTTSILSLPDGSVQETLQFPSPVPIPTSSYFARNGNCQNQIATWNAVHVPARPSYLFLEEGT